MPCWFWMQPALPQGQGSALQSSHPELTQILKCFKANGPTQHQGHGGTQIPGPPNADILPSILPPRWQRGQAMAPLPGERVPKPSGGGQAQ